MSERQDLLRSLPAVDRVLREEPLAGLITQLPQEVLTEAVKKVVDRLRQQLQEGGLPGAAEQLQTTAIAVEAAQHCRSILQPSLRKVINATGTLLHTNLGRAPLARRALQTMVQVAEGYSNLEFELDTGVRGERHSHVEALLTRLTGAEAALVVNNNAGAVLLALTALGKGREAIVSRGELVEIGGAFRIPEVMETGGVILHEVGASNRTHLHDYQTAINEQTALLLKVHTSNYRIVGFTSAVPASELVSLAREHQLIVLEDLGSGMLTDLTAFGLPQEPTVAETVQAGVDVVTFSGDKLLGGPQAGLIVGRADLIRKLRRHPLARALRIDKLTLAALEATLQLHLQPNLALQELPVLRMFAADPEEQKGRCEKLYRRLQQEQLPIELALIPDTVRVGGGAMPLTELPDWAVEINLTGCSVDSMAQRLRDYVPAVVPRVQNDRLLLNLRAVAADEEDLLAQIVLAALRSEG